MSSELACYPHDSSDGSAYRSDTYLESFVKCLGEVIW